MIRANICIDVYDEDRAELEALLERLRSFAARDSGHLIRNWDTGIDHVKDEGRS
jgi:hypothetical protein